MKTILSGAASLALAAVLALGRAPADRWVWVFGWPLDSDRQLAEVEAVVRTAAESGLTGVVLSAGLDRISSKPEGYAARLERIRSACERAGLELVPAGFSIGYGTAFLAHDRNLAEGLPVVGAPFVVARGEGRLASAAADLVPDGGFEGTGRSAAPGFSTSGAPDRAVKRTGRASLRLQPAAGRRARAAQELAVVPRRCYRLSVWVRTEGLTGRAVEVHVTSGGRDLAPRRFKLEPTAGWRKLSLLFNSAEGRAVRVSVDARSDAGRLWLDDLSVRESGPVNVLRRPGTPVTVTSADGGVVYEEGRDYEPLTDPGFDFVEVDRPAPPLRPKAGGRIRDGQRLRVGWYHPMVINESQVTVCMGEPEVYRIVEEEARRIGALLRPRRFLLTADEIRMGGTCRACSGRPAAELLGGSIARQAEAVRRAIPGVSVLCWSDMLDPGRNATAGYYFVNGDLAEAWRSTPRDVGMAVWGREASAASLDFFAARGFRILVAGYYDAGDLSGVRDWLRLAAVRPAVTGIMYTTWVRDYALLPEFGRMTERERAPAPPVKRGGDRRP